MLKLAREKLVESELECTGNYEYRKRGLDGQGGWLALGLFYRVSMVVVCLCIGLAGGIFDSCATYRSLIDMVQARSWRSTIMSCIG